MLDTTASAFEVTPEFITLYNDPASYHLPENWPAYMQQDIGTYPGLECSASNLVETSSPWSAATLVVRPYDHWWVDNVMFTGPTGAQQCVDPKVAGEQRGQGCWAQDGTYIVAVVTDRVMIYGNFTVYQSPDRISDLRAAVDADIARMIQRVQG